MLKYLLDDTEHRKSCRSLLCMCCAFFKVYDAMAKTGIGNPTSLVLKWNGESLPFAFSSSHYHNGF